MNEIINRFLLAGHNFAWNTLWQPKFTYSPCRPFTKNKERIQKIRETGNSRYIYKNGLDKVYFQCDISYGDFQDLPRRTASDKVLCDNIDFNLNR